MSQIAGSENQPAEQVFKNVQVLKGITAAELVQKMDKDYATAMSWNCTNCHRLAPQGNFASDTSKDKKRARFMQQMQNDINQRSCPSSIRRTRRRHLRDVSSRLQRTAERRISLARAREAGWIAGAGSAGCAARHAAGETAGTVARSLQNPPVAGSLSRGAGAKAPRLE